VIARSYGYDSWPKLKAYVDGVTAKRFSEAVRAGDLVHVRAMLKVRPELASGGMLDAVLNRSPEIVRVLMDHGANARAGMYPHRDATSPLTIATERGCDEIVAIISEEEQRRRAAQSGFADAPAPEALFQAIASGDDERAIAMMAASPALVRTTQPPYGLTPLHVAAKELNPRLVTWLLDRGADAKALARIPYNLAHDHTPLDLAAHWSGEASAEQFAAIASTLFQHGAGMTARAAVALGDAGWVRARHAQGVLVNPIEDSGLTCFRLVLERCDPNMRERLSEDGPLGLTILHSVAGSRAHVTPEERVAFATMLLDAGARLDIRDNLPREHAAWLGMPVGTRGARYAAARPWRGSDRGGR
jgi:Ankyrin repeat